MPRERAIYGLSRSWNQAERKRLHSAERFRARAAIAAGLADVDEHDEIDDDTDLVFADDVGLDFTADSDDQLDAYDEPGAPSTDAYHSGAFDPADLGWGFTIAPILVPRGHHWPARRTPSPTEPNPDDEPPAHVIGRI